jgi:hypothetical protein
MPGVVNLAPSGRTLLISDVSDASPTASSHPQVCQRELCHGLCPSPVAYLRLALIGFQGRGM